MEVSQAAGFAKVYKKLHKNQLAEVNEAIDTIIANPLVGELKKGDLAGLRVYKFSCVNQLTLLGYTFDEDEAALTLIALSSHENFYRDVKRS